MTKSFTLIETLMTIAIFTLSMGAIAGFIVMAYRTYSYTFEQAEALDEARRGIETMVKEIREAKTGDDGSYPIEKAEDKEFIFYSDVDEDGKVERVRYFLGTVGSGTLLQKCVTFSKGGSCSVSFSNFLSGNLKSAQVKVSIEGDLGWQNKEYAEIYADGIKLGTICKSGCSDCAGAWQGTTIFDVTNQAKDNTIQFIADATSDVDTFCDWEEQNHALNAQFEFTFTQELTTGINELKKGVVKPTSHPVKYPLDQEKTSTLSSYVRNSPPIFEYFDQNGNKITDYPARLKDTKLMKVFLVVDVDPNRPPLPFELESSVQLRNLKEE